MSSSYQQLVAAAKREIREITAAELASRMPPPLVVDVRESHEFLAGTVRGARLVPRGVLGREIGRLAPHPDTELVLVCSAGNRSALAAKELQDLGYRRVFSLAGGLAAWRLAGGETALPGDEAAARYARHLVLPGVGQTGQERLGAARVLVVGAGGLGSPVLLYLAAAGVGTIGVVDADLVDVSNLQRQIVHQTSAVGRPKAESAAAAITALNPTITVVTHPERLVRSNARRLLTGYDVVVDGSDNFETRYLLNDATLELGKPLVHGSVYRWEGQLFVVHPDRGPCYRCLFPEPPPPEVAPDCAVAGVFGGVVGVIGSLMAVEAAKLVLDAGDALAGALVIYDGWGGEFTRLAVPRRPGCVGCAWRDQG
jgi:molybdopterin/thiamine biosynthesis adenylyltransferase/rhodanese-related sulfurtransferase